MTPRPAAVLVALVLVVACAACGILQPVPTPPPTYPRSIMLGDEVLQNMFEIQAEYARETVRCLTGFVVADTVYVTSVAPTWINRADSVSVNFRGCTAPFTVGWYHNHPGWIDANGERQTACWIEDQDVRTLRGFPNFLVAVITCDDRWTTRWLMWWTSAKPGHVGIVIAANLTTATA